MIRDYEHQVKTRLGLLSSVIVSTKIEFTYADHLDTCFIKGSIVWVDESQLVFSERYSEHKHRYRFHYMDTAGTMRHTIENSQLFLIIVTCPPI